LALIPRTQVHVTRFFFVERVKVFRYSFEVGLVRNLNNCKCRYHYLNHSLGISLVNGQGFRSRYSDSLQAGRSGDRIPVAALFSAPAHTGVGPTQPPVTGYRVAFPGAERPGSGVDHPPPPPSAEVKKRAKLCLYYPSRAFMASPRMYFTFTYFTALRRYKLGK
jgi:hypothetical protein